MKRFTILLIGLSVLAACADKEVRTFTLEDTDTDTSCTVNSDVITCPDGTTLLVEDEVLLTEVLVPSGSCTEVLEGVWVENIQNGTIFDVYANAQCRDVDGEYCDNVKPSYGSSGQFGENKRGNGTLCSLESSILYGEKSGNHLIIKVLEVL